MSRFFFIVVKKDFIIYYYLISLNFFSKRRDNQLDPTCPSISFLYIPVPKMSTSSETEKIASLKIELKKWEHSFKKEHGKPPSKEDIKKNREICKYFVSR